MGDQLTAKDWLDQGLKTLAKSGFTALKAEPLAKTMGVSRGSFYWHFADIGAFHAAILKRSLPISSEPPTTRCRCCSTGRSAANWRWKKPCEAGPRSIPLHARRCRPSTAADWIILKAC